MRERNPARVFRCFTGCKLAGDAEQGASREFSGATPAASVLSFRVVWIDRSHRRGSLHQALERQISARRRGPNHWLGPGIMETGCEPSRAGKRRNPDPDRSPTNRELSIKANRYPSDFYKQRSHSSTNRRSRQCCRNKDKAVRLPQPVRSALGGALPAESAA